MKKTLTVVAVMVAVAAQAALWSEDFSAPTFTSKTGGDLYPGDVAYGDWGRLNATAIYKNASDELVVNGSSNADTRSAGVRIAGATLGTGTDLTLNYDVIDINNNVNTKLHVQVWEAKTVTQAYYMDLLSGSSTAPSVKSFGDAYFAQLGSAEHTNADVVNGSTYSINFTRVDTTADLIIMFGTSKTVTFVNSSRVDNIEVVPEPATLGLIAAFGGGILFIRRRFMI